MSNLLSPSGLPLLTHDNYADWAIKVSAAVMKKADVKVMLGEEVMPTLAADLSNADAVRSWQRDSQVAGYIFETLTPEAHIHVTDHQNGPLMWSQLKAAISHTNSASQITHLEALLMGQQATDQSISSLIAHLSECWQSFVNAQPVGFTLNELNEELFCWGLICQLDPQRYADLRLSLIKKKRTSPSLQLYPLPPALNQASLQSASQTLPFMPTLLLPLPLLLHPLPSLLASGAFPRVALRLPKLTLWSIALAWRSTSKTRASLNQSLLPRLLPILLLLSLQVRQVHPGPPSSPDDTHWIADSGTMSNMTSHKEWIVDYVPLCIPIRLGDHSIVYSAGVGTVWIEPLLSGHSVPLVSLSRMLHVPHLKSNLLSITYLSANQHVKVSFLDRSVFLRSMVV